MTHLAFSKSEELYDMIDIKVDLTTKDYPGK